MMTKADIRAEAARLQSAFFERGADGIEADILQPAEVLLDLYGEDIRARAFVTQDPLHGETMLRPDFTVPVAQSYLASGLTQAAYCYAGEVFRRQEEDESRAREYFQVGYERFGGTDRAREDAEVFTAIASTLGGLAVRPVLGDIGIISALIDDLETPDRRKNALRRHIWRPTRFRTLLDRFARKAEKPKQRDTRVQHVGLRSADEIDERLAALTAEVSVEPLAQEVLDHVAAILAIAGPAPKALERMAAMAPAGSHLAAAVAGVGARLEAIAELGIDPATLYFEASYGRTTMEYYNGFVFGFTGGAERNTLATGGRFDLVTHVLGRAAPAVGGVIRPDLVLELAR